MFKYTLINDKKLRKEKRICDTLLMDHRDAFLFPFTFDMKENINNLLDAISRSDLATTQAAFYQVIDIGSQLNHPLDQIWTKPYFRTLFFNFATHVTLTDFAKSVNNECIVRTYTVVHIERNKIEYYEL